MWIRKLSNGVLRVLTPLGPRYIKPSLVQRLYLCWIFRHFPMLPLQVLSEKQRHLIETLCARQQFVSLPDMALQDAPLLGTVERRPRVEVETSSPRRPNGRVAEVSARVPGGLQQRS